MSLSGVSEAVGTAVKQHVRIERMGDSYARQSLPHEFLERPQAHIGAVVESLKRPDHARLHHTTPPVEAGEGWSDSRVAEALDTSIANVERTRRQLLEEGFEAVLTRKYNPNSARPRIFDGAAEAELIALGLVGIHRV
ncbi:hypothetical protein [Methylocystis sp. JR02]|uniref:hypothetical protein n=1 Tax=Methylocystis sp. JR02 TaxID=3046284 RepID=UPI0024BB2F42|nr:hypothetical protein [Methylocystis sp. JR02]MDJ0448234.1 hypothetical protein [Methylocystis sp. JR02]